MITVDAKGKNCPIPVVMTKKEIEAGATELMVEVDNSISAENVSKLAAAMSFNVSKEEIPGGFRLSLMKNGDMVDEAAVIAAQTCSINSSEKWAVFVGKEIIGSGAIELGSSLMKMFFYTLSESENLPAYILIMNEGVKLVVFNDDVIEHLQNLQDRGVEILVCGTCLNFYEITEQLKIGNVSNMYDMVTRMQDVSKLVTI